MNWKAISIGIALSIGAVTLVIRIIDWHFERKDLRRFQHLVKGKSDV